MACSGRGGEGCDGQAVYLQQRHQESHHGLQKDGLQAMEGRASCRDQEREGTQNCCDDEHWSLQETGTPGASQGDQDGVDTARGGGLPTTSLHVHHRTRPTRLRPRAAI